MDDEKCRLGIPAQRECAPSHKELCHSEQSEESHYLNILRAKALRMTGIGLFAKQTETDLTTSKNKPLSLTLSLGERTTDGIAPSPSLGEGRGEVETPLSEANEMNYSPLTTHFSQQIPTLPNKGGNKAAFTLAEVLITLGIIGVVAAIGLQPAIHNYRSHVLHKQFLKSYSNLNQAILLMKNDLGIENFRKEYATYDSESKTYPNNQKFYDEFDKYINVIKMLPAYNVKSYHNTVIDKSRLNYRQARYLLPDGTCIGRTIEDTRIYFIVDLNCSSKGPNRFGFDIFYFQIATFNKDAVEPIKMLKLYSDDDANNQSFGVSSGFSCGLKFKGEFNGMGCSWYALNDINPDDETKKYWDNLPW